MKLILFLYSVLFLFININDSGTEETNSTTDYIAVPGKPVNINVENISENSAHIIWSQPPSKVNITHYELVANVLHTYSNTTLYPQKWTYSINMLRTEIAGLHPGTKYNISIRAESKNGPGLENFKVFETKIAEPDHTPEIEVITRAGSTMIMKISPTMNNNGPISFYRIVIINTDQMQLFQQDLLAPYDQANADGLSYYIAADTPPQDTDVNFIIGDRRRLNGFYNAPLDPESKYIAFVGVVSKLNGVTKIRYPEVLTKRAIISDEDAPSGGLVTGLAVAVGFASVLLVAGVVALVLVRKRFKQTRRQRLSENQELCVQGAMIQVANHGYIPEEERVNHYDVLKKNVWSIPRDSLQVEAGMDDDAFLGFGSFGHVVRGSVQKPNDKSPTTVACYVVTDGDLTPQKNRMMLRQLDILVKVGTHENIASLIGTYETPETVYIVTEYFPLILKELLLNDREVPHTNGKFTSVTEEEVIDILIGISNGMNHLMEKNVVHERLCTRNVLMEGKVPKITGHGLSYYHRGNSYLDYTRWQAPEVFSGKPVTLQSDVWSYGVLSWELCCVGGTPYNNIDGRQLVQQVARGIRLQQFRYMSEEFYQLLIMCWQADPEERPTFLEINQQLSYFKEPVTTHDHLNFDISSEFAYEPYEPNLEIAGDEICHRNVNQ